MEFWQQRSTSSAGFSHPCSSILVKASPVEFLCALQHYLVLRGIVMPNYLAKIKVVGLYILIKRVPPFNWTANFKKLNVRI